MWDFAIDTMFPEQVLLIARAQRQFSLQLDSISKNIHEYMVERSQQDRADQASWTIDVDSICVPLIVTFVIGGICIFLLKGLTFQK